MLYNKLQQLITVIIQRIKGEETMEKYEMAYTKYIKNCEKHGIERIIDFKKFMEWLTYEQLEMMINEAS